MTEWTTEENDQPEDSLITYHRTTTWTNGATTYEPVRTKTLDHVTKDGSPRITSLEKWYDTNNKIHNETGPALITHEYTVNQDGQLEHTGIKHEHYYYHGWTTEEAAKIAYSQNKITEEEYHQITHPEKSVETTHQETVQILNKGL